MTMTSQYAEYLCPDVCSQMYTHSPYAHHGQECSQQTTCRQQVAEAAVPMGKFGTIVCKPKHDFTRAPLCHNHTVRVTKDRIFRNIPCTFTRNGGSSKCTMVHFEEGQPAVDVWKQHPQLCPFEMMSGRCNQPAQCTSIHCLDNSFCNDEDQEARAAFMQYWNEYGAVCLQSEGQKVGHKVTRTVKPYSTQEKLKKLEAAFEMLIPYFNGSVSQDQIYQTLVMIGDEFNERSTTFVLLSRFLEKQCTDHECACEILKLVATNSEASVAHVQDAIVHLAKRVQDTQREPFPLARAYGQAILELFEFLNVCLQHAEYHEFESEISSAMLEIFSHVMDLKQHAMQTKSMFKGMWERIQYDQPHVFQLVSICRSPIMNSVMRMLQTC